MIRQPPRSTRLPYPTLFRSSVSPGPGQDALMKQLGQLGWVEGRNLAVERRWADRPDRLADVAAELIRLNVSVILKPRRQDDRSEEHTSELQSHLNLVFPLLL